ncbi:MAG: aminopeptidase [Calditrichaeota bacterium]|nr:MAG: aminopeptidase [Calditrichota bacterium]
MNPSLYNAVRSGLLDCLNLKKEESLLIVTDDDTREVGEAFYQAGKEWSRHAHLLCMPTAQVNGQEPEPSIAQLMTRYDVVVCPTQKSMTHTDARRNACKAGARVATLPGITTDVFIRTMQADYNAIAERTYQMSALLEKGRVVKITTALGTNLTLPIGDMPVISSTGLIREKGKGGNLPSGESFLCPVEGESYGTLVVDASFAGVGTLTEPITIEIEKGHATTFRGGEQARVLEQQLRAFGEAGLVVAELGVGTNESATISGLILEDEKVFGTIHIAFGNNISMGGHNNVGIHLDGVVLKPNMWIDDQQVIKEGDWLVK